MSRRQSKKANNTYKEGSYHFVCNKKSLRFLAGLRCGKLLGTREYSIDPTQ